MKKKVAEQIKDKDRLHQEVWEIKKKIARTVAFLFYNVEEFSLFSFILGKLEDEKEIRVSQIVNTFTEGEKLLKSFKDSMLITFKENNPTFTLNQDFFRIIPRIQHQLTLTLTSQLNQLKQSLEMVTCRRCRKKRDKIQVQFMSCECNEADYIVQDISGGEKEIEKIMSVLPALKKIRHWCRQLKEASTKEYDQSPCQSKFPEKRATDLSQQCLKMQQSIQKWRRENPNIIQVWEDDEELIENRKNLIQAMNEHQPKMIYKKIQEMKEVRQIRTKRRQFHQEEEGEL